MGVEDDTLETVRILRDLKRQDKRRDRSDELKRECSVDRKRDGSVDRKRGRSPISPSPSATTSKRSKTKEDCVRVPLPKPVLRNPEANRTSTLLCIFRAGEATVEAAERLMRRYSSKDGMLTDINGIADDYFSSGEYWVSGTAWGLAYVLGLRCSDQKKTEIMGCCHAESLVILAVSTNSTRSLIWWLYFGQACAQHRAHATSARMCTFAEQMIVHLRCGLSGACYTYATSAQVSHADTKATSQKVTTKYSVVTLLLQASAPRGCRHPEFGSRRLTLAPVETRRGGAPNGCHDLDAVR